MSDRAMYAFRVRATDNYDSSHTAGHSRTRYSTTATVQVWMIDVDDEPPAFIPSSQSVRIKERLIITSDLLVSVIQAYDPDSENIRFTFQGELSG